MKAKISIVLCAIVGMMLASCHSSKKGVQQCDDIYATQPRPSKKPPKRLLGFEMGKHDNRQLYEELQRWLGAPYRYGGESPKGTDCSGMVMMVYLKVYGKKLERNSAKIYARNCRKIKIGELHEGDLVFFSTAKKGKDINHVGIYLKDGKFIHASSSRGVIISSLDAPYYRRTFIAAGRVK